MRMALQKAVFIMPVNIIREQGASGHCKHKTSDIKLTTLSFKHLPALYISVLSSSSARLKHKQLILLCSDKTENWKVLCPQWLILDRLHADLGSYMFLFNFQNCYEILLRRWDQMMVFCFPIYSMF